MTRATLLALPYAIDRLLGVGFFVTVLAFVAVALGA